MADPELNLGAGSRVGVTLWVLEEQSLSAGCWVCTQAFHTVTRVLHEVFYQGGFYNRWDLGRLLDSLNLASGQLAFVFWGGFTNSSGTKVLLNHFSIIQMLQEKNFSLI